MSSKQVWWALAAIACVVVGLALLTTGWWAPGDYRATATVRIDASGQSADTQDVAVQGTALADAALSPQVLDRAVTELRSRDGRAPGWVAHWLPARNEEVLQDLGRSVTAQWDPDTGTISVTATDPLLVAAGEKANAVARVLPDQAGAGNPSYEPLPVTVTEATMATSHGIGPSLHRAWWSYPAALSLTGLIFIVAVVQARRTPRPSPLSR